MENNFTNPSLYLKFGEGDPWAGQVRDKDSWDSEVISESLESSVTLGAEPPIGSWQIKVYRILLKCEHSMGTLELGKYV